MQSLEVRQLLSAGPAAAFLQPYVEGQGSTRTFAIYYSGPTALDATTLGNNDIVVTGPNGFSAPATFVGLVPDTIDPGTVARYRIAGIKGGAYAVDVQAGAVADASGATVAPMAVGGFRVGRHGRTIPRGPDNSLLNTALGTTYGPHGSPPPIDTSFGPVVQAINFGGGDADLVGSDGQTIHFDGRTVSSAATPATLQTAPFRVVINSAYGNDLYATGVGSDPVYETEIFSGSQTTEFLTISGLDPARRYQFQFLHGDERLGSVAYQETDQIFTLSTGQTLTTSLAFNTAAENEASDTTVDVTGTTSLQYTMPYGQSRGPSFSAVVIEEAAVSAPSAGLVASTTKPSGTKATFDVVYYDPAGIIRSSLGRDEMWVTDADGATAAAELLRVSSARHGQHVVATYQVSDAERGASYDVSVRRRRIAARSGATVPGQALGTLTIDSNGYGYLAA